MPDAITRITDLINTPPGQFVSGGVVGGIVFKFFKNVGDNLNDETIREITRWLRVKHFESGLLTEEAATWPETFAKVFDRVFGASHLSWKCFGRSCVGSLAVVF